MKKLFPLSFLLFFSFEIMAQDTAWISFDKPVVYNCYGLIKKDDSRKFRLKEHIAPVTLMILSGVADGFNQALQYRYEGFKKAFPKARDQWFRPDISWRNKYKNGNPDDGRRFPGSKTWLVGFTDGYHFTRLFSHLFTSGAIAIKIGQKRQKWYIYIAQAAAYMVIERIGFNLVYYRF